MNDGWMADGWMLFGLQPYTAVIPEGVTAGSGFEVVVDGQIYLVSCPKGGKAGDTVAFDLLAQVLSQVVDGGLVNVKNNMQSTEPKRSWSVVSQKTNVTRLTQQLASPRIHWIRMREQGLPMLVSNLPSLSNDADKANSENNDDDSGHTDSSDSDAGSTLT
mmetsp:Transcript_26605/g.47145  ORF Transcript_26605/g.47145 Transcript_26605/m.47145 type:complete len:161 (+) Transcript_26605:66-548(+)